VPLSTAGNAGLERALRQARPGSPEAAGNQVLEQQRMLKQAQAQGEVVQMTAMSAAANFVQQGANLPDFQPELERMLLQAKDIKAEGEELNAESQFKLDVMHTFCEFQEAGRRAIERFVEGQKREAAEKAEAMGKLPGDEPDLEVDAADLGTEL
jgi:hypothetical protein